MERIEFYISYFYNVRFLDPDILPISTALFDPTWYSEYKGRPDKRGVINGVRIPDLNPPLGGCPCIFKNPNTCEYLWEYNKYLENLDWEELMKKFRYIANYYGRRKICLLVYEAPNNPCSERAGIIKLFNNHNIKIDELIFKKEKGNKTSGN